MLLILTNKADSHADHLIRSAGNRFPLLRINTDDFLNEYDIVLGLSESGSISGSINDKFGRRYNFSDHAVAWYRKPNFDGVNVDAAGQYRDLVVGELRAFFEILYSLPSIQWVNHPIRAIAARSKWQQLLLARRLGFLIPPSLITTNYSSTGQFARAVGWPLISKSIYTASIEYSGMEMACTTVEVSPETLASREHSIALCPTQFQKNIVKAFELRVTVVGDRIFATKIDSQGSSHTKTDWRLDIESCPHEPFILPRHIEKSCLRFLREQDLEFGAIDLIVTPSGDFVFLENNPFGQYLWLELLTGVKITDAIIELFESKLKRDPGF